MSLSVRSWLSQHTTLLAAAFVGATAICISWSGLKELQADSFRLLYAGRYTAEHGVPYRDVFTLAAQGRSFADQQWLGELIDYEVWRVAGYSGLAVFAAGIFGGGYALLTALLRRRGASVVIAISCALLATFGALTLTFLRAQLFAVPLFVVLLWLCLRDSDGDRMRPSTVLLAPLIALWANLHGSVVIATAVALAYLGLRAVAMAVKRDRRQTLAYAGLALLVLAMPLATPYGTHVLAYYLGMFGNHAVQVADVEWDPPAFPDLAFFQFVIPLALAAAATLAAIKRGRRPSWPLLVAVVIIGVAAATVMRNNMWLAIAAAALIADTSAAWLPSRAPSPRFISVLAGATAALAVFGIGRLATRSANGYLSHAPLSAVAATASYTSLHPCADVLGDNTSASALLWLDPSSAGHVAFDGELEVYSQPALTRWIEYQTANPRHWTAATSGYQVLMGTTADHPELTGRLAHENGASVLADDGVGVGIVDRQCQEVANG